MKHSMSEFWNFTKKEKKVRGIYCMRLKLKKKTQVVCVPSLELVGFYIYIYFSNLLYMWNNNVSLNKKCSNCSKQFETFRLSVGLDGENQHLFKR